MCSFQCRYGLLARDAREIIEELVERVIPFEVIDQVPQRHPRADEDRCPPQYFRVAVDNRRVLHSDPPDDLYMGSLPSKQRAQAASWKMMPSVKRWPERRRLTPGRITTRETPRVPADGR